MPTDPQLECQIQSVYHLDHASCKAALLDINKPRLDFTEDYLDQMSVDRLRHILVAVYLQAAKTIRGRRTLLS
jgi:hypothetical protein